MQQEIDAGPAERAWQFGGVAGWLLSRLRVVRRPRPKLAVLERIALAPRHSLALVEADGRRILVATSPEGAAAFFPLDETARPIDAAALPVLAQSEGRGRGRPGAVANAAGNVDRGADGGADRDARFPDRSSAVQRRSDRIASRRMDSGGQASEETVSHARVPW